MNKNPVSLEQKEATNKKIYTPAVDIFENENHYVLLAEVPGCSEKDIEITIEKNILKIYGSVQHEIPDEYRIFYSEYGIGDYERSFELSNEIDKENIEASVKNGVLKLVLPKIQPSVKKIEVKVT